MPTHPSSNEHYASELEHLPVQQDALVLLDQVRAGIALTDADGLVVWCNAVMCELFLQSDRPGDWQKRTLEMVLLPLFPEAGDQERIRNALARLQQAVDGHLILENLCLGRESSIYKRVDLELSQMPMKDGAGKEQEGVAWFFHDVTPYRQALTQLHRLTEHSSEGIFVLDHLGRLLVFNRACEIVTGWRASDVLRLEDRARQVFRATRSEDEAPRSLCLNPNCIQGQNGEWLFVTHKGELRWIELNLSVLEVQTGQPPQILGLIRDIGERKRLEKELHFSRKLATLGEFASVLAHEIKNPLGIISAAAQIVANPKRSAEDQQEAAAYIVEEARQLSERLEAFLRFSRPCAPQLQRASLAPLVAKVMSAFEASLEESVSLRVECDEDLPVVAYDPDQIQQVVLNLLLNAREALNNEGEIVVQLSHDAQNDTVSVMVSDTGPGLPEGQNERLFEPFFSTRPKGTGLGLAVVKQIVSAHQGTITARNHDRGGACFTVTLPVVD